MAEYKTLEQAIIRLWKSRGLTVLRIVFKARRRGLVWTITAREDVGGG